MRTKIKKGDIAQCKLSMYDKEGQKLLFLAGKTYYFDIYHYVVNETGSKTYLTFPMQDKHFNVTHLPRVEQKDLPENGKVDISKDVIKYELKPQTKCVVLGEKEIMKPIQLFYIRDMHLFELTTYTPTDFKQLELISRQHDYDLIFAFNDLRSEGEFFLGRWNNGIAE